MTKDTTPSAQWDSMSNQQKIEWLAKLEGYTNDPERVEATRPKHLSHSTYDNGWLTPSGKWIHDLNRNYLTDWNHWRQVEEKVMENDRLLYKYIQSFWNKQEQWGQKFVKADLPTRCRALFLALQ